MALFRRRPSPDLVLHPALGSRAAAAMLPALRAGDVAQVQQQYDAVALRDRTLVLQVVHAELSPAQADAWLEQDSGSALAWAVRGAQTAWQARETRGYDTAAKTPDAQMAEFVRLMHLGRQQLLQAVRLDEEDPGPWYQLLCTDYAGGAAHLSEDLEGLLARSPHDVEGVRLALDLHGQKWFGAPGEARELAERVLHDAPDGDEVHVATAWVLRDEWFYTSRFDGDDAGADAVLTSPASRQALRTALDRSVRSPRHVPTESTALVRNHLAHVCTLAGEVEGAFGQFVALQGLVTRWPWETWGDPVRQYDRARPRV